MASLRIENLKVLKEASRSLRTETAVRAVLAGQAIIVAGLQRRVPVGETHRLYKSIRALKPRATAKRVRGYVRVGTKAASYAVAQEYGSIHNRAHPFWYPTLHIDGPRAEAAMWEIMNS